VLASHARKFATIMVRHVRLNDDKPHRPAALTARRMERRDEYTA
jgi:hypothetical protein